MQKAARLDFLPQYDRRAALLANRDYCRRQIDEIKSCAPGCLDCKVWYPAYVLQFDHRPGTRKKFNISEARSGRIPWRLVKIEIEKTDLVCANCHLIREHLRSLTPHPGRRMHAA